MQLDMQPQPVATEPKPHQAAIQQIAVVENKQKSVEAQSRERQFTLTSGIIRTLLETPEFKSNITIGKVLKVIQAFIENDETVTDVARHLDIDETMVNLIKACVK
jgi:hypothetical protein